MKTITMKAIKRIGCRLFGGGGAGAASVELLAGLLVCLAAGQAADAQGTIYLDNDLPGVVVSHVYAPLPSNVYFSQIGNGPNDYPAGVTSWTGFTLIGANGVNGQYGAGTTYAQLLAAPGYNQPESSLVPQTPYTTFRAGAGAGFVPLVTVTLNNVGFSAPATVEMVAWDDSSGLYSSWTSASAAWLHGGIAAGASGRLNLTLGSPAGLTTCLTNLPSFNLYIIPEPSTVALAGLGLATLFICRRSK